MMRENLIQKQIRNSLDIALRTLDIDINIFIDKTGLSSLFLHEFISGKSTLSTEELFLICSKLNISADFLFGFSNVVNPICYSHSSLLALNHDNRQSAEDYIEYLLQKQIADFAESKSEAK